MRCDHLEPLMEAIADGSFEPTAEDRAHLESCARCRARLADARTIEHWLASRELAAPSATFTSAVMARIVDEKWKAERVIDIGFNLAVAAGVLVIVAGGAGLAWSLGFLTVTVDLGALFQALDTQVGVGNRVLSEVQTIAMSAVLLTMALGLWWWAETATD